MTGGERLHARYMRQDPFEFTPQFTLVIAGNHRPSLRAVDEAIRRRFHLVPFRVTIPKAQRDDRLAERLREEWPGILDWMIDGCLAWQNQGLAPPRVVVDATNSYLEEEDSVAAWVEERCETSPGYWAPSMTLLASWREWAESASVRVGSQKGPFEFGFDRGSF
jgi:putative DNA primase/helicase